jgi:hypothetical protein
MLGIPPLNFSGLILSLASTQTALSTPTIATTRPCKYRNNCSPLKWTTEMLKAASLNWSLGNWCTADRSTSYDESSTVTDDQLRLLRFLYSRGGRHCGAIGCAYKIVDAASTVYARGRERSVIAVLGCSGGVITRIWPTMLFLFVYSILYYYYIILFERSFVQFNCKFIWRWKRCIREGRPILLCFYLKGCRNNVRPILLLFYFKGCINEVNPILFFFISRGAWMGFVRSSNLIIIF